MPRSPAAQHSQEKTALSEDNVLRTAVLSAVHEVADEDIISEKPTPISSLLGEPLQKQSKLGTWGSRYLGFNRPSSLYSQSFAGSVQRFPSRPKLLTALCYSVVGLGLCAIVVASVTIGRGTRLVVRTLHQGEGPQTAPAGPSHRGTMVAHADILEAPHAKRPEDLSKRDIPEGTELQRQAP